eukprot:COSAG02_NODE_777_length_17301_cov_8.632310_3_plen_88_part_00
MFHSRNTVPSKDQTRYPLVLGSGACSARCWRYAAAPEGQLQLALGPARRGGGVIASARVRAPPPRGASAAAGGVKFTTSHSFVRAQR